MLLWSCWRSRFGPPWCSFLLAALFGEVIELSLLCVHISSIISNGGIDLPDLGIARLLQTMPEKLTELHQGKTMKRGKKFLALKCLDSLVCGLAGKTCCISKGWNDYINLNISSVTSLWLLPCLPANTKPNRWAGAQQESQERSLCGEECSHCNFCYFLNLCRVV